MTPEQLDQEDAMAHSFLSRAANAIVRASDLSRQLADVSAKLTDVSQALSIVEDVKLAQDERIAALEAQLATALEAEARAREAQRCAEERAEARQRDVHLLDARVAELEETVASYERRLGDAIAKSALQDDALSRLITTYNNVRRAMGQPDLDPDPREEIEAACSRSPSDDIGDGLDDPNYRRNKSDDAPFVDDGPSNSADEEYQIHS